MKRRLLFLLISLAGLCRPAISVRQLQVVLPTTCLNKAAITTQLTSVTEQKEEVPPANEPAQLTKFEEKRQFWKGQKVTISFSSSQEPAGIRRFSSKTLEPHLLKDHFGKTGVITDVIEDKGKLAKPYSSVTRCVVALDGVVEKLVVDNKYLGFLEEMEIAKSYVGKTVWVKNTVTLIREFTLNMPFEQQLSRRFTVKHTERLLVTRAEWGDENCPIYLCFKTDGGEEGCKFNAAPGPGGYHFDGRFGTGKSPYLDFFFEDPRKRHPDLTEGDWEAIKRQEIVIGMKEQVARLACPAWALGGMVFSTEGSGLAYRFCGKVYLVNGGKILKEYRRP